MEEKELIILAIYINVQGRSHSQAQQIMDNVITNYQSTFDDLKNKNIKTLFFPITDGVTRVECIYPISNNNGNVESELIKLYKALLSSSDEEVKEIMLNVERKLKLIKIKGE